MTEADDILCDDILCAPDDILCDDILCAAVLVLASVSKANLAKRRELKWTLVDPYALRQLADEIEAAHPGWVDRVREAL